MAAEDASETALRAPSDTERLVGYRSLLCHADEFRASFGTFLILVID
jgi:hypothetical protein